MLLERIASVVEVERAHRDHAGAVDAEPTRDLVPGPLQRQLVLGVRAGERRVRQQAEVVHAVGTAAR